MVKLTSLSHVCAGAGLSFTPISFPTVVTIDGHPANNSFNIDGLPSPLRVHLSDADKNPLPHANCVQCVIARLVKCTDASSAGVSYPSCSAEAQAKCATASSGKCENQGDYLHTLSGTTTANVENGTAVFTDIQLQHVSTLLRSKKFVRWSSRFEVLLLTIYG